ncbi:MAG TPA: HAMP domain-containing sensor histidine kinase [Polyangiaceae bacterium]|nr:HAMP domain-containing sensor histidine kinase [Polyangiaceae bacterium]
MTLAAPERVSRERRARLLVRMSITLAIVTIVGIVGRQIRDPLPAVSLGVLLIALAAFAVTPVLIRKGMAPERAGLAPSLVLLVLPFAVAYPQGGLDIPVLVALTLAPLSGIFFCSRRVGVALAGLALAGLAVLTALHLTGHRFPSTAPSTEVLRPVRALLFAIVVVATTAFAWFFESERARAEAESERLKDEFVSTVSHELRTPLAAMRGALGLMDGGVGGELSEKNKELLQLGLRNARRLEALVDDLLDVQRMSQGRLALDRKPTELRATIASQLEQLQPLFTSKRVQLRSELQEVGAVVCDAGRISEVVDNLVSNALKFSEPGDAVVVALASTRGKIRVTVRDQGPGIPAEFQRSVFQRFAQAEAGSERAHGGSGLGLSICKGIVEAHGGQIGFETGSGGTTFTFELPAMGSDK